MSASATSRKSLATLPVLHPGDGSLVPVSKLFEELGLRRPHPSSIWRFCARGTARAGRLPALHVLGCWHSTAEALTAWLERGTAAALNKSAANNASDEELRDAGLLDSPSGCRTGQEESP
jgi:hypothetical protein